MCSLLCSLAPPQPGQSAQHRPGCRGVHVQGIQQISGRQHSESSSRLADMTQHSMCLLANKFMSAASPQAGGDHVQPAQIEDFPELWALREGRASADQLLHACTAVQL